MAKGRLGVGVAEVRRREPSAKDLVGAIRSEIDERMSAAFEYERLGRPEHAARLRAEAATLESYVAD